MYSTKVLELFRKPLNAGGLQGADIIGKYENQSSSEVYKLYIKLDEDKQVAQESRFKTMGNPVAIAVSSAMTQIVIGKTVDEMLLLTNQDVFDVFDDIPMEKEYCVTDIINCLQNGIKSYLKKIEKENKSEQI